MPPRNQGKRERGELPDLARLVIFDEQLREVAADRQAVLAAAEAAAEALDRSDERDADEKVRLLGYLANAERALGNYDRAASRLGECLAVAEQTGDERAVTVTLIRLGEVFRSAERLVDAERYLRMALARSRGGSLEDFALQHLGKCLTDAGRLDDARGYLSEALRIREAKADPDLVSSTRAALERVDRLRAV